MNENINHSDDYYKEIHSQIMEFYRGGVNSYYADRCLNFFKNKQQVFDWLFEGSDRIKLTISDEEAVEFFFIHNQQFHELYCRTLGYLTEMHSYLSSQDIKLSIYRNKIRYEKNEFKFSKFYNRYVKTGDDPEIDFQKFYDNLKTAECILSIHPLDFIGASTDASFTSCLSVDSCHHTATTAYLKDDITIIAYTKRVVIRKSAGNGFTLRIITL